MSDPIREFVQRVRADLIAAADPAKAPGMQAYMKSTMPYYGIPSPVLKSLLRNTFRVPFATRPEWERAVRTLWDEATHREERYAAITLTGDRHYSGYQDVESLDLYRHLLVTGAWWDFVDEIASRRVGPILRRYPAEVTPLLHTWANEADLWLRRTAIICQLGGGDRTDLELLADAVQLNLKGSPYGDVFWIRKAIGWALRQYARTDPAWVRSFVEQHAERMSGLTRREALKHLGG